MLSPLPCPGKCWRRRGAGTGNGCQDQELWKQTSRILVTVQIVVASGFCWPMGCIVQNAGIIKMEHKLPNNEIQKIALVIFARNEATVIGETVQLAKRAQGSHVSLFVIADRCVDETALVARRAGARVFVRNSGCPGGKGSALVWFVKTYRELISAYSRLVILDADSRISPDFIAKLEPFLFEPNEVLQCFLQPIKYEASPVGALIALSELVEQSVYNRIRTVMRASVRLRGTGMIFTPQILLAVCDDLQTEVEDIVLSLLVAELGFRIIQLDSVKVYDPKPAGAVAASRQRARWIRGQWAALWSYRQTVVKVLGNGLRGWILLSSLFLKPRWLVMVVKAALAWICIQWPLLSIFWGGLFVIDCLLILYGAFQLPERNCFFRALLHLPEFVWMWLRSILLSFRRLPWLRTRRLKADVEPRSIKPFKLVEMDEGG